MKNKKLWIGIILVIVSVLLVGAGLMVVQFERQCEFGSIDLASGILTCDGEEFNITNQGRVQYYIDAEGTPELKAIGLHLETLTPTITNTPTITFTPTITGTATNTPTATSSATPISFDCDLVEVDYSFVGLYGSGYYGALVRIRNNNPIPIHLYQAYVDWDKIPETRYLYGMQFNLSAWVILDDMTPPTTWNPAVPIEMSASGLGDFIALMKPVAEPIQGETSVDLLFENGCTKSVSSFMPSPTPSLTPTVSVTPTP